MTKRLADPKSGKALFSRSTQRFGGSPHDHPVGLQSFSVLHIIRGTEQGGSERDLNVPVQDRGVAAATEENGGGR
jgi:hypothetical protein